MRVVLILGAVALTGCAASPPTAREHVATTHTVSSSSASPVASGQTVTDFWPVGASTVWLSAANLTSSAPPVVLRSTDGGTHWTVIRRGFGIASVLDADHIWLGNGTELLATSDAGQHWQRIGPQPQCTIQFVTPLDGWCSAVGGAMGADPVQLYRTTDGGSSWKLSSRTAASYQRPASTPGALPLWCDKYLWFTEPTEGWAIFGCNAGHPPLYRTDNGGATWQPVMIATPPGQTDDGSAFTGIPVLAGSAGAVPFTADQPHETVMYRTDDHGASWAIVVPPGPPQWWVADAVTPTVWRLLDGDQLLATDDAGRTWTRTHMNHRFGLLAFGYNEDTPPVDFVSARVGYVEDGQLWRTTDGGRTWTRLDVPGVTG